MDNEYYQGYVNIFSGENVASKLTSTIYCISDYTKSILIMIPLSTGFFRDALSIARSPYYQKIYIMPPSLDCLYISDTFNLYQELKKLSKKEIYTVADFHPTCTTSDDFMLNAICGNNFNLDINFNGVEHLNLAFQFNRSSNPGYRESNDVVVSDGITNIYFSQYMSNQKIDELWDLPNTQIHMSFANNIYGGLTYLQAVDYKPELKSNLFVHSLQSIDEYNYCANNGINIGKVRYNDFVGTRLIR